MSEEIIIDGVNVAECDYILSNLTCIKKEIKMKKCIKLCGNIPNCHYKQLQRLKQENEELKARFNEIYNNAEQLANKYNKYDGKKENELAEIINKTTDERNKYKQENEELKKRCKELDKMTGIFSARLANKYKRALEGIREIAKDFCKKCTSECDCIIDNEPCEYYDFYKIREKINEVLNV